MNNDALMATANVMDLCDRMHFCAAAAVASRTSAVAECKQYANILYQEQAHKFPLLYTGCLGDVPQDR